MLRQATVVAMLGGALIALGDPAPAAVSRPGSDRTVARPEPPSPAESAALDNLLERSGLGAQLHSLSAGVRVQFLRSRGELSGEDRVTIDRIVSARFAPEVLHARIRLELAQNLDGAKLSEALEWYGSSLGRRITGLELEALFSGAHASELESIRPSTRRLELLQRLDVGSGASETTVDVTITIVRSLLEVFRPALNAAARPGRSRHEDPLADARTRTLDQIRRAYLVAMLLAYRELSDDDLDRYVQFVESEAGQWYLSAVNGGLLSGVARAAEATAAELATAMPRLLEPR
jgi:hypothetical protein